LRELARSGAGSMRDAQSNFDQVISFSGEKIESSAVTSALGFAGVDVLRKTVDAIAERDTRAALAIVDDLISRGHDLRNFCRDVLGALRDLLVFKVAGGDEKLLDAAVFGPDDLRSFSTSFTEADLVRFFNSLCDTEAALREAAHPRYVLEIGLVKLIEMRSLQDVQGIIERLDALASGAMPPAKTDAATAGSTAPAEKKTLKTELPPPAPTVAVGDESDTVEDTEPETVAEEPLDRAPVTPIVVRLAPLSSVELTHVDDPRLDAAYEEKLALTGDDLLPIGNAQTIADKLIGVFSAPSKPAASIATNGHSAAAPAMAIDLSDVLPQPEEAVDLPVLGEDPTEQELMAYAEAHPAVRNARRVFRAKIVEVRRA
jgi:DNA polymerase III gamma/tau subunit